MRQEPLLRHCPRQPRRHLVASGQDRGHWLRLEAGQSEPQHRQRRCVEPLDVVDREQQPVVDGELPQGAQERECDNALLGGWTFGFRERERGFERTPLRPGQLGNTSGTTPPIRSASPTNENAASASAARQESTR